MKTCFLLLLSCCVLMLGACSSAKKQLGLGRNSPDEFAVIERAPLTLPPDYTLRPPLDGTQNTSQTAQSQAKRVIIGSAPQQMQTPEAAPSDATQMILQQAGAANVNPNIRATLDKETAVISSQSRTVAEKLLFWDKDKPASLPPEEKLDATQEAQRLNKSGITSPTPGKMRQPAPADTTTP